jgi:tetratricopeptide (TPR) repeat protein
MRHLAVSQQEAEQQALPESTSVITSDLGDRRRNVGLLSFFLRPKLPDARDYLRPLPSIEESVVELSWEPVGNEFNLYVNTPSQRMLSFRIDPSEFSKADSGKLADDVYDMSYHCFDSFQNALNSSPGHQKFRDWWMQKASISGQLFQFDFANGPWSIPWELLLGLLVSDETRSETAFVRCMGSPKKACESLTTKSLQTMIIRADAPDLNLDKEIDDILAAWAGLEFQMREAVARPVVVCADRDTIIAKLKEVKPDIIWFSGHGSYDGTVRLRLSDEQEVTANEFGEMFARANHFPEFAVFWACETARGTAKVHSRPPDLFSSLSRQGVSAMVGMQSCVHDFAAIAMAAHLFRGLSQGIPLEWAVARARRWLYQNKDQEQLTMDWAAPVVWSSRRPVVHLDWSEFERFRLQMQLLGTISIAQGQKGTAVEAEPRDTDSCSRALNLSKFHATIVRGKPDSAEHQLWFRRLLKGLQSISNQAVLLVDAGNGRFSKHDFENWAARFLNVLRLERGRLPDEFFVRMDILSNDAEIGWRRICSLSNVCLGIIDPPPASEDWFWKPLFNRGDPFAVLTDREVPEQLKQAQANHVLAGRELNMSVLEDARKHYSRLLLVLSVLNIPAKAETLRQLEYGEKADMLFRDYSGLFVSSFGGYVICAKARDLVIEQSDPTSLRQARIDVLELTNMMVPRQKPYLLELRIDLLIQNGELDIAVQELSDLLDIYMKRNEQVSIVRTASRYFQLRDGLSPWEWLVIAAVYLQLGDQANAELWLTCNPEELLDQLYKMQLVAEFTKNKGHIDNAREILEGAMRKCEEVLLKPDLQEAYREKLARQYLEYRHDRARLIHWQEKRLKPAADEYMKMIELIDTKYPPEANPDFRHLLAVAHRNLGECILGIEEKEIEVRRREAESHFQSALTHERQIRLLSHLIAETHYQLAKLARQKGLLDQQRNHLNECIDCAEEIQQGVMAAIGKNRLFWLDYSHANRQWADVAEEWDLLADHLRSHKRHSWASRTLIDSNIRVARELMKQGRTAGAGIHLQENISLLRSNPGLRRQSDADRIILTLAGLEKISRKESAGNEYWLLLDSEFSWAKARSIETESTNADQVWERMN